jgi:hypothetical protein
MLNFRLEFVEFYLEFYSNFQIALLKSSNDLYCMDTSNFLVTLTNSSRTAISEVSKVWFFKTEATFIVRVNNRLGPANNKHRAKKQRQITQKLFVP